MGTELEWIGRLRRRAGRSRALTLGIGDDCAIFRPRPGHELLLTTDLMIEGVHFLPEYPAAAVGHKALARGLSDIAAMGGEPRLCLVSLAAGDRATDRWIGGFYDGLLALARRSRTALAGGDLSRTERSFCDIVVCGSVPAGTALRRDGARAGDTLWVSGPLGGAAAGLAGRKGAAWRKHLRPEPRLEVGRKLRGRATAAIDLSDGLALDLHRLCLASGVAARITAEPPVFRGATLEQALGGGDDYELLFTLPPARRAPAGCVRIGEIVRGKAGAIEFRGRPLAPVGYDHFLRS